MALGSLYACAIKNGMFLPECSKAYAINCHLQSHKKLSGPHSRIIPKKPMSSTSNLPSLSHCSLFSDADICQKKTERVSCGKGKTSNFVDIQSPKSFLAGEKFQLNHVIEAQQFDCEILSAIFEVAREMEKIEKTSAGASLLKGYLMATLFYEPSTRTRLSFESAMKRLGGEVLTTENAREFSSASKGETLEGTHAFLCYGSNLIDCGFVSE